MPQDIRYALRVLRRTPAFTAVAIATLAVGIGAATTIFSVVDSVLLRPLGFPDPQQLVMVRPDSGSRLSPEYLDAWRRQSSALADLAGWHDVRAILTGRGEPIEVLVDRVTANFFEILGAQAHIGRTFGAGASLADVEPHAVVSYGFWQRRYGGDPAVIGESIILDGTAFTIVGVMPHRFGMRTNELAESRAELWTPFPLVSGTPFGMGGQLNVIGRLSPAATAEQARAELSLISDRIELQHPSYSRDWRMDVVPLHEATVRHVRPRLWVLFGAVGILLLAACANLASLTLMRSARRERELAVRISLGATGRRLFQQLLLESVVLAGVGGALGIAIAVLGTDVLVSAIPGGFDLPRTREIGVDISVLTFAALATTVAACLTGVAPAISSSRFGPGMAPLDRLRGAAAGFRGHGFRAALLIVQVALAVVLLDAAGLLGRTMWGLGRVDPGFEADRVLTFRTTLPAVRYDGTRARVFGARVLERLENLPGVLAAGLVDYLPMSNIGKGGSFRIEGRPDTRPEDAPGSWISVAGGRYFEAMGIRLLRGRLPGDADTAPTSTAMAPGTGSAIISADPRLVFVIDEALANQYWPGDDPIGAHLVWRTSGRQTRGEVIGVVESVRWGGLAAPPPPTTYFWFPQHPDRHLTFVVRAAGDPRALSGVLADVVKAVDPNQPIAELRTLEDLVAADLSGPQFTTTIVGGFAAAALLLAALGVYGAVALGVSQRTREIGIRVALGAQHRDVLRLVLRRGFAVVALGCAIGIPSALAISRLIASLLYGVGPADPATLGGAVVSLGIVAMLASYLPAQRALRVDPSVALRAE